MLCQLTAMCLRVCAGRLQLADAVLLSSDSMPRQLRNACCGFCLWTSSGSTSSAQRGPVAWLQRSASAHSGRPSRSVQAECAQLRSSAATLNARSNYPSTMT